MSKLIHLNLSNKVLGLAFKVHNTLGPGLVESAYEEAYCMELSSSGIMFERQRVFPVVYNGQYVSSFIVDIVVANTIVVELKSVKCFLPGMDSQLINYLKLSRLPVGYLVNFHNARVEWKRFVNTKEP